MRWKFWLCESIVLGNISRKPFLTSSSKTEHHSLQPNILLYKQKYIIKKISLRKKTRVKMQVSTVWIMLWKQPIFFFFFNEYPKLTPRQVNSELCFSFKTSCILNYPINEQHCTIKLILHLSSLFLPCSFSIWQTSKHVQFFY